MNMNMAHIHIILNHIPILGTAFVALAFLIALIFRNVFLQKLSLWFLALAALSTAAAYLTGDGATHIVESLNHASPILIHDHESMARISLIIMFFTGIIALFGIVFYTRKPALPRYLQVIVMAILIINTAVLIYVGYLGGLVSHPEIRSFLDAPQHLALLF
ncbi:hypothetical protein [Dictyobacter formicarum]|uniref:DUF2231 domain-containing protein n=1 Tax=Dictyobacter formicarum TaxID=2778368 RepID=A0ABQ3V8H6_9CHLR|nr:hypothetical protein [Dictyobacter formicarum]GHO82144.1 hypothetical protein KSZ_01500 [Dictyobacter formicarum]